ncbi:MAG TPA: cupredoxin family copper-binding protein, partial [Gemmatimonadaceae bacterium]|nr:cupredoxin family copper-binding protein [Gemmatimonadaceae bacterium]
VHASFDFTIRMILRKYLRLAGAIALASTPLRAQSLLDRSPNLSGDWVGAPGTLYFHFLHRFTVSDAPQRKVSNVPTFLLGAGLPKRFLAGFNYSTNSTLAPNFPNEWEAFARWSPIAEDLGKPLDLGGQIGYNNAADGVDGEISAAKRLGRVRLVLAGRALSDPLESGSVRFAVAGGGTFRLGQYVAIAGDVASLTDRDSVEKVAWSAGLNIAIPLTPHTLSLHATNAPVGTLQGQSRGSDKIRYGFEFTIPLTLRRYFGKRAESPSTDTVVSVAAAPVDTAAQAEKPAETTVPSPIVEAAPAPATAPPPVSTSKPPTTPVTGAPKPTAPKPVARVRKTVIKNISYMQPKITIPVGTTVEWTNNDPLPHSVTAADKSFNSGLIQPGKTYRHTFAKAGTYNFYCIPHPFMKGVITVTAQ